MWINFGNRAIARLTHRHFIKIVNKTDIIIVDTFEMSSPPMITIECKSAKNAKKCVAAIASAIATESKEIYLDSEFFK
jgi:low affinity Fe/Cu permease